MLTHNKGFAALLNKLVKQIFSKLAIFRASESELYPCWLLKEKGRRCDGDVSSIIGQNVARSVARQKKVYGLEK